MKGVEGGRGPKGVRGKPGPPGSRLLSRRWSEEEEEEEDEEDSFSWPQGTKEDPATSCYELGLIHPHLSDGFFYMDPNQGCPHDSVRVFCNFTAGGATCIEPLPSQFEYSGLDVVQLRFLRLHSFSSSQLLTLRCSENSSSSAGDTSSADHLVGDTPSADHLVGDTPSADHLVGDTPSADHLVGDTPSADHLVGDTPSADQMLGDTPSADHLVGDTPSADHLVGDSGTEIPSHFTSVSRRGCEVSILFAV
ncbi:hypothetical protein JOQ06_005264 [Pogonophryne albipinna]|uniref:Fibrillar collagen NC1 domain-containing protein n=1 Tax=Pogonophryne albipinna TaxID=1090488 RepID=A0AAD6BDC7_9TELE|nr:hypothetical protein JOQ06_005264 [Pogonophryne albipinna]